MLAKYTGRVTAIEHRLLVELSASSGTTLAYGHLMERVWDRRSDGDSRPMRSADPPPEAGGRRQQPSYIFTEPRVGYRMARAEGQGEADAPPPG